VDDASAKFQVANFISHQPAGQRRGVDRDVDKAGIAKTFGGRIEEGHIEPDVVSHDHRVSDKFEKIGEGGFDRRSVDHHGVSDAGQNSDRRRDRCPRVDQSLERANLFSMSIFDRTDLGYFTIPGGSAGGFEVEDAK
jgi:hypothetical protein